MAGPDFLGQSLSNIQNRYLKFWNYPLDDHHRLKTEHYERFYQVNDSRRTFEEAGVDIEFDVPDKPASLVYRQADDDTWNLVLDQPVNFKQGKRSDAGAKLRGLVDFQFMIKLWRVADGEFYDWNINVALGETQLLDFDCSLNGDHCDQIRAGISRDLGKQVFSFTNASIHEYDLPLALTQLRGFFRLFEEIKKDEINQVHMLANEKFLGVFMNCKASNVIHAVGKGIHGADRVELKFYQNALDGFGFQHGLKLTLDQLMRYHDDIRGFKDHELF